MSGAFATSAMDWHEAGCFVLPILPDKSPAIKGWNGSRPQRRSTVSTLMQKFPKQNLGIATGKRSGISVVDVDDASQVQDAIDRFGDSPLKTTTPSGGLHLYYRYCGERSPTRPIEGLSVDVRGDGGIIIAPPSKSNRGAYRCVDGGLSDLARLPPIKPDALPEAPERLQQARPGRNDTLFRFGLREARYCSSLDDVLDVLITRNEEFMDGLPDAEVEKTAASVWKIQSEDRNWSGREPMVPYRKSELLEWPSSDRASGDAMLLHARLRAEHRWRNGGDFILANAFAKEGLGWGLKRFRSAKELLERTGRIECVHRGGQKEEDPPLFRLRGVVSARHTNSNRTPPPLDNQADATRYPAERNDKDIPRI